jgi:hypothetical protein
MLNQNDYAGAFAKHSQAESIRNGIDSLKGTARRRPSSKTPSMRRSDCKQIEANTGDMFRGR